MITQAIKRWFQKLFVWWPRQTSQSVPSSHGDTRANAATSPESTSHASVNSPLSQPGISPLIAENTQNDVTCSTLDEPPGQGQPQLPGELSSLLPAAPSAAFVEYTPDMPPRKNGASPAKAETASQPTPQQRLDFLHYLVRRGLVNEGFTDGQTPDQYRRDR